MEFQFAPLAGPAELSARMLTELGFDQSMPLVTAGIPQSAPDEVEKLVHQDAAQFPRFVAELTVENHPALAEERGCMDLGATGVDELPASDPEIALERDLDRAAVEVRKGSDRTLEGGTYFTAPKKSGRSTFSSTAFALESIHSRTLRERNSFSSATRISLKACGANSTMRKM